MTLEVVLGCDAYETSFTYFLIMKGTNMCIYTKNYVCISHE